MNMKMYVVCMYVCVCDLQIREKRLLASGLIADELQLNNPNR